MADLVEQLDAAAAALLERSLKGDVIEGEEKPVPVPIAEQIRAFDAVAKWAVERNKVVPKGPTSGGQFDRLKQQFHSSAPKRGRRNGAAIAADEAGDPADA
jgi:hypothetical protein